MIAQVLAFQIDAAMMQGLGTMLTGIAAVLVLLGAFVNRHKIGTGWMAMVHAILTSKAELQRDVEVAVQRAMQAEGRALSAEHSTENWRAAYDGLSTEIDNLRRDIRLVKERNDALVDYTSAVLTYCVELERRAHAGGIDLSDLSMPEMPEIIADRLNIPDSLR